ncbi:DEAD/DEAH box helicase family protein [Helicobacter sp.]|uniref:putative barnase/colicin E5 family endoribonuclease n=1 Tax=Helicobacter sp. TaxID=218 RepID=UPI0019C04DB4|nr:DEAD/DEAH box helicase family protein [Helicobacter sp.]MBD5165218.1 DEAD/DEAH box helicase family protein [Helicobacter sp.]
MEQTQKLKKYDFEKAFKSGYSKSQIVNSLRNNYDTNLDWERINEDLKELKPKERDEVLFDSLYNHQDSWGILGLKTKEQPKGLQNRILSDNQIQDINQEVQKLPQWAIESALKPQIIGEALGINGFWKLFQNKEEIARSNALKNALDKGIAQKLEKGEELSIGEMMRYYQANEGMKGFFSPKAHYQKQKELEKIAQTDFQNLDESQKKELKRQYRITRLWNDERELHEKLKDAQTKKEADAHTQAVSERLERDIINLQRTYENIFKSGVDYLNDSTEQSDRYKEMIQESALSLGFDGIGFKGDRIYAFKGDKAIFIDDGFFHNLGQILGTNAFDIGGSITGAIAGAKRGKGKIGTLAGGIAGGAIGAGLGGIADSIIAQFNARGEFNLADALLTGAESATFDIAGGLIVSGGAKAVKGAAKGVQRLLDLAIPVSVLKNSIGSENIQAAKELIEQTLTPEQKDDILEFSKSFGGNLELEGKDTLLTKGAEYLTAKYGADSTIAKVANSLENYSRAHNKAQAREEILTLIRADESGRTLGILLEVAKNSTLANKNLREILNATSYKLKKEIEGLGLKPNALKEIFADLKKGTQEDYDEVFNKILGDLYGDEKVVLNGEAYAKFRQDLGDLIELDPQGMQFLRFVEKRIYDPNGVNFVQLNNARKILNEFCDDMANPSTKKFIENEVKATLREDIESGIQKILLTRPDNYEIAKRMYDTALGDYSVMKDAFKTLKDLEFNDLSKKNTEIMDNLLNFIQGDGGEKEINNYSLLTKGLKKEQIESLELNALNRIYEKNLLKDSRDSTFEVFNSAKFLEDTAKLREIFQSDNAKKFVEIMQGFNRLFGNDARIALELGFANPPKEGSAIAQSVKGAIEQKIVKGIFGILMRNLPTNNKVIDKLGFKEKVQKMALAHHIEQALKSAYSINDFNFTLKKIGNDPNTPTPTRMAIESFNKELTKLLEEARENADISKNAKELEEALGKANLQDTQADFGTNYPQFYHKGSEAIAHLLETKSGQVQGAFYREDLQSLSGNGEIDLVWGEITDKTNHKGYGLAHIIDKHPELDLNKIPEIVENGKLVNQNGTNTIWHKQGDKYYKVGISKGFKGSGENQWVITAYEVNREKDKTFGDVLFTDKQPLPNSTDIIPQPQPKNTQEKPTLQEKIQALKAQRKKELEIALQAKMAKEAQASQALREAQQERQRIKDAQVGKAINEIDLNLQGAIRARALKPTRINLENKSYPAKFVIIKKEDLKPNFETKGTQGRTQKQENVIKDIQENLNPNKLFFSEGGFEGLPIILRDGQVSVGNHRAEALKNLSQESKVAYKKSAKEIFGIDLKDDELIVRMLDERIPNDEILNLSFASNVGREQNLSEKALSTLGKYQENLDKLPTQIYAQNVEEMQQIVAKSLDKANNGLNTFDTNLALFASLAKSKDKNILDAINAISGDAEQKAKVIKMFVENAGNFHNLAKQTQLPNLDLRDYLTQALYFTAKADSSRVENFKEIAQEIKSILQTTDKNGKNALIDDKSYYDELVGKIMGYSFARFRELENPSGSLFDFLANIKQGLKEELEPTLFSAGRELQSANIYDFLSLAIKSGIPSNETSEVLELLPQLKAKHEAIKEANAKTLSKNISAQADSLQKESTQNALKILENTQGAQIPKELNIDTFMKSLENVENKENFIKHLQSKTDAQSRLAYLNLVEPTLKEFDLKLTKGERESYIKIFNDGNNFYSLLITQEQDKQLITFLPKARMDYIKRRIESADLIQTFTDRASNNAIGLANDIIPQSTKEAIDQANRFAEPFSNEQFSALPKAKQAQYQSLQKQAGVLYNKYHQAKGVEAKRVYEKQYNAMLDKIYNFEQKYPVRVSSTQVQVRTNTTPSFTPDEIIDVEIIEAEPSIQKQITYKRHNLRAKAIQSLQIKLEALKPYPQKQIEYKRLESQINVLVEKQHKELQQPSLFSEEDLAKAKENSIIQNKITKGEKYGTTDSNKSGEINTGDNQLTRIGDNDLKQNQGEIQLEERNREQGKTNRQHTQTIPQKSTKQDSSRGGMGGEPSISSHRSGSLQENPRSDRLGQNRNPRSRECLFVANGKRGVGSTKSTSRGFGNATKNLRVSDRLADNIQSTDNPQGLLSPAQQAEVNQRYKPAEIIETGNAKQIVKHNLKAIQTLAELLENNALATNEQKDLLHNFRGFGKASNEMLEIMRNPQNKTAQEFTTALQKINEIVGTKLDLIQIIRTFADSYYTPQPIVRQMIGLLKDRIANQPSFNVLEPSVGVGRFLGELPNNANIYAVERDELSALLAKNIYPHAKVETSDFQKSNIANIENAFDLVIGNPPYSSTILRDQKGISGTAHNYFLQKNIKSLRPNGISIQIVTHNFLDSNSSKYREIISKEAKFLGAVRLPSGTFKDTEVVTDIVAFRKLNEGESVEDLWVKSSKIDENVFINDYFKHNPHHILGETKVIKNQFGKEVLQVINPSFDIHSFDLGKYIQLDEQSLKGYTLGNEITKPTENVSTQRAVGEVTIQNGKFYKYLNNKVGSQIEFNPHQALSEITTWSESTIKKAVENYQNDFPKIQTLKRELENLRILENSMAEDTEIESARARLNKAYDDLLKGYSFKNESGGFRERFRAFVMLDDTAFELLALEKGILTKEVNGKTKIIGSQKADIFTQRQIYPYKPPLSAQNLNDAVTIAKNETGKIDIERINSLLNRNANEIQKTKEELLNEKFLFLDSKGEITEKADFLSGNVKQKLQRFKDKSGEVRFSEDDKKAKFQKITYESLKEVQPIDIDIADVTIPLGANWIPKEIHEQFLQELGMREISLQYEPQIGWLAKGTGHNNNEYIINTSKEFRDATGVKEINALNYIEKMFNNNELLVQRAVTEGETTHTYKDPIATRALQNAKVKLQKEFKRFIVDREDLLQDTQKRFNDLFNAEVPKTYDGSHLSFIGMNRNIHLRPHQKNAVYRILTSSNTLLAHAVGTGKTYTLASSVMEANRLGQARKSMIVLPNYLTTQFATEARQLYPNAKIAVVNGINKKLKNRQLEQLKNNQYDLIVTTYTAFKEMDISRDYFQKIINEEVYDAERLLTKLQKENAPKRQIKSLIDRIDKLRQKAILREEKLKKEGVNVFFDDLGLDGIYFDEAHYLKSLPITTRQPNVRGINTRESERAMDALMKIRQMQDFNKKVVFSTGTPVTNYVSDIYIMQKYLSPNKLKERGVEKFDDWCSMFAEASTEFELKPTGDYAETTRLRRITNLIELNKMYFDFTDLITKEEMKEAMENMGIKNVEPKVTRKQSVNELSKGQVEYLEEIYHRAEELKRNPESAFMKGGDNHLKIINDARKASLDLRLVNPNAPRDENSKVVKCANNVKEIYDRYNEDLGTQLVFLDLSTPKRTLSPAKRAKIAKEYEQIMESLELGKATSIEEAEKLQAKAQSLGELLEMSGNSFSLYDELKTLLKEKGIKEDEIAFIHDYDAKKGAFSKEALSDKINSGKIRILIGSTGKMGAGCNFQERLVALHHLDLDWTPANMEQREGRIIRQGNKLLGKYGENFEVEIHNYITKNSSDSIMLQTLENKQRIIKQMQDKTLRVREVVDDSEDDIYGMLQALGSENGEEILEMLKLGKNINLITNELESFDTKLKSTTAQLSFAKANIKNLETQKSLLQTLEKMPLESLNIQGKEYLLSGEKTREKFNQALSAQVDKFSNSIDNVGEIATIGEYKILAKKDSKYIIFRIGKDLKENVGLFHFEVNNRATTDYYRRFAKEFKEIAKGEAQKEIDIKIQSAHATRQRHEKTLKNLNNEDRQNLETELNAYNARYKELEELLKAKAAKENKDSDTLQTNPHLGSGIVGGSIAGFEQDKQGNLHFNPANFLLGLAGGVIGSKAVAQGFKAISKNPEFKAKVTKELADTLSKGWDSATKAYPILSTLEPRHIIAKSEKGRDLQARHILKEVEKEAGKLEKVFLLENRINTEALELPKPTEKLDFIKQSQKDKKVILLKRP